MISLVVLGIELVGSRRSPPCDTPSSSQLPRSVSALTLTSAMEAAGATDGGGGLPEVYASYAAKEVDIIRALVIALNLRALNSTRGYVLFTHNSDDAFKAIVAKYDRPELRNALNFRFGKFPDATMDPVLTTPPKFINLKQWRFAWIKVAMHSLHRELSKVVMLDIDTFMVEHMDELFTMNSDAVSPEVEPSRNRGQGFTMKGINSGTMLLIPKPSSERAMVEIIKTKIWHKDKISRVGDQNYFEELLVTPENRTGRPRVPAVLLAPHYNMNTVLCKNVGLVKNWHAQAHKPWRIEHRHPSPPCVVEIINGWLKRYRVLRAMLDNLDIQEPPTGVINLTWANQNPN